MLKASPRNKSTLAGTNFFGNERNNSGSNGEESSVNLNRSNSHSNLDRVQLLDMIHSYFQKVDPDGSADVDIDSMATWCATYGVDDMNERFKAKYGVGFDLSLLTTKSGAAIDISKRILVKDQNKNSAAANDKLAIKLRTFYSKYATPGKSAPNVDSFFLAEKYDLYKTGKFAKKLERQASRKTEKGEEEEEEEAAAAATTTSPAAVEDQGVDPEEIPPPPPPQLRTSTSTLVTSYEEKHKSPPPLPVRTPKHKHLQHQTSDESVPFGSPSSELSRGMSSASSVSNDTNELSDILFEIPPPPPIEESPEAQAVTSVLAIMTEQYTTETGEEPTLALQQEWAGGLLKSGEARPRSLKLNDIARQTAALSIRSKLATRAKAIGTNHRVAKFD